MDRDSSKLAGIPVEFCCILEKNKHTDRNLGLPARAEPMVFQIGRTAATTTAADIKDDGDDDDAKLYGVFVLGVAILVGIIVAASVCVICKAATGLS